MPSRRKNTIATVPQLRNGKAFTMNSLSQKTCLTLYFKRLRGKERMNSAANCLLLDFHLFA